VHLVMADSVAGSEIAAGASILVALIALGGTIAGAVVSSRNNEQTSKVADEANANAKQANANAREANEVSMATAAATNALEGREEWWKRAQWAIERACDDTSARTREVGVNMIRSLAQSQLAHDEEKRMLASVLLVVVGGGA
jgi:hypothetical protein